MTPFKSRNYPTSGLVSLVAIYIVWSSTYLAIRIAVREGSGFPPFMMAATRTLAAGLLLMAWMVIRKHRIRPSSRDWKVLVAAGLLLWIGGNGMVTWAVEKAGSGFAALSVGTLPLWTALVESIVYRRRPSLLLLGALLVGFSGLLLLHWQELGSPASTPLPRLIALILAPMFWATGSVIQTRYPVSLGSVGSSAWQQLIGCVGFFILSLCLGEPLLAPSGEAVAAWFYLVVAGGIIAFTAYMVALKKLPVVLASTYAYINPVAAVFLGWLILNESVNPVVFISAAMIVAGVAGVFRHRFSEYPENL